MLGCTVAGIKVGLGLAHYNAYCSGSITYDQQTGNPKYVNLSAGSNGEGIESGNGDTNVTGKKPNGVAFSDPDSYTVPSDREHCGSTNAGTVLRASSNAKATAYVDGTLPNGDKAGRTYEIEWDAAYNRFTCVQRRKNADGSESEVECEPPEPS